MVQNSKNHLFDFIEKFKIHVHIFLYVILILSVAYVNTIPSNYKYYGSNPFVRLLFFGITLFICKYVSFIHSLLFALFVCLYISFTPGYKESFENLRIVARNERRWLDERILGEDPELMENEKVRTEAVQSS